MIQNIDFQKAVGPWTIVAVSAVCYQLDTVLAIPTDIFITIRIELVEISRISVLIQSEEVSQAKWETKKRTHPTLDFLS